MKAPPKYVRKSKVKGAKLGATIKSKLQKEKQRQLKKIQQNVKKTILQGLMFWKK